MTETAALSHYVLPARSGYESWDGTFFPLTYPGIFFQMRRPIVEPEGEPLELGEIHLRLAEQAGADPPDSRRAVSGCRRESPAFAKALMEYAMTEPGAMKSMPFILGKTLGKAMGSVHLAALWGMLQVAPKSFQEHAARAGFTPGLSLGEEVFQRIVDHPEGVWVGKTDPENNRAELKTEDGKINLQIPELLEELQGIDPPKEKAALTMDTKFPLVLMAGRHTSMNANTLMRDPAWNEGETRLHARDAPRRRGRAEFTGRPAGSGHHGSGRGRDRVGNYGNGAYRACGDPARLRPRLPRQ